MEQVDGNIRALRDLVDAAPESLVMVDSRLEQTPLHVACSVQCPNLEAIKLLATDESASKTDIENYTALHHACGTAAEVAIIRFLLSVYPTAACLETRKQDAPLHIAFRHNASVETVRLLIDAYPDALGLEDQDGMTPIHLAAIRQDTKMKRFLLERKPSVALLRDRSGRSVLHSLCRKEQVDRYIPELRDLVDAAPEALVMVDSRLARTPLHVACSVQRPSLELIKLLATDESASKTDFENYTALHQHACNVAADVAIISFLLSINPTAACVQTRKQDTPLHIACGQNASAETPRSGTVQVLLDACPSSVSQRTNGGETALHLACSSGAFVSLLQLLTSAHQRDTCYIPPFASSEMLAQSTTNKIGDSPLHGACFRVASFEHLETLAKATPEWIVVRNNAGFTPLHVLCKSGRLDERVAAAFSRLCGPEVFSVMDSSGYTPLHSACREGNSVAAIRSLIRAFPDALHVKTEYGDTPLHLSCVRRLSADVVSEIAASSSDGMTSTILETNTAGQTPIGIAMDGFDTIFCCSRICSIGSNLSPAQTLAFDVS